MPPAYICVVPPKTLVVNGSPLLRVTDGATEHGGSDRCHVPGDPAAVAVMTRAHAWSTSTRTVPVRGPGGDGDAPGARLTQCTSTMKESRPPPAPTPGTVNNIC
jgi:hypothetical protein